MLCPSGVQVLCDLRHEHCLLLSRGTFACSGSCCTFFPVVYLLLDMFILSFSGVHACWPVSVLEIGFQQQDISFVGAILCSFLQRDCVSSRRKPRERQQASGALAAKRLFFPIISFLCLSGFVPFFLFVVFISFRLI